MIHLAVDHNNSFVSIAGKENESHYKVKKTKRATWAAGEEEWTCQKQGYNLEDQVQVPSLINYNAVQNFGGIVCK